MKGKHKIVVSTKRLKYEFELHRNLTIIRGDSATGKTTLVDMIRDHINNPSGTPVELVCDKTCYVLEGNLWKAQLSEISDGIVFIDEGNEFIKTEEFAGTIQKTDNYYVIVTVHAGCYSTAAERSLLLIRRSAYPRGAFLIYRKAIFCKLKNSFKA